MISSFYHLCTETTVEWCEWQSGLCSRCVVLDCNCVSYWQWRQPYSVSSCWQRSPLDGGPTVTAVVPQDDLSRVCSSHQQVGMKPGETHRYYRRLGKQTERGGEDETAETSRILFWCKVVLWEKLYKRQNLVNRWSNMVTIGMLQSDEMWR